MKKALFFILTIVLCLGILFRFNNLDRKVYWLDETYTSLRISGFTISQIERSFDDYKWFDAEDILDYQRTNNSKTIIDTAKGLITEDIHPPLYFFLVRLWVQLFGNSVAVTRSCSAAISLLVFPCIYWLCQELFQSPLTGWIAMALMATSPFQLVYAQEARPYSLWTATILLSSSALLRATRRQTVRSWAIYGITLILGFYTHSLFLLVSFTHFIYIASVEGLRFSKTVKLYGFASISSLIFFAPWLIANFYLSEDVTRIINTSIPSFLSIAQNSAAFIARQFFDIGLTTDSSKLMLAAFSPIIFALLMLVIYSAYFLYKKTDKRISLFVLCLMVVPRVTVLLIDLITNWTKMISIIGRYSMPSFLGIQLAVSFLLAAKINNNLTNKIRLNLSSLCLILLVIIGIISCFINSRSETWWNTGISNPNLAVAKIVNNTDHPVVISQFDMNLISLSYRIEPGVKFLIHKNTLPEIPNEFKEIFIYTGFRSPSLYLKFQQQENNQIELEPIVKIKDQVWLWKLVR